MLENGPGLWPCEPAAAAEDGGDDGRAMIVWTGGRGKIDGSKANIGTKQYLAVQASGRHLHPVKFDNFQDSSYLFVFSLN